MLGLHWLKALCVKYRSIHNIITCMFYYMEDFWTDKICSFLVPYFFNFFSFIFHYLILVFYQLDCEFRAYGLGGKYLLDVTHYHLLVCGPHNPIRINSPLLYCIKRQAAPFSPLWRPVIVETITSVVSWTSAVQKL